MTNDEAEYWRILTLQESGKFSEAAPRLAALIAKASDARFHAAYGICLQQLGRWRESIVQFENALALKPAYCEADWRNMLAQSYLKAGQKGRAVAQWRIVAQMEPCYPSRDFPIDEAKRMLNKFDHRSNMK
ncbi:MAG: tetratricopeptide repeat protein [Beijerinckiaceae bacterium]